MRWLKSYPWPACVLSAATVTAVVPLTHGWAQSGLNEAAPSFNGVVLADGTAEESDVQRELRRLYEQSGRAMPDAQQQNIRLQRPQAVEQPAMAAPQQHAAGAVPSQPATYQPAPSQPGVAQHEFGAQHGMGGAAPMVSAPRPQPGNPVSRFFRRFVPGGQSKPAVTPAPVQQSRPIVTAAPPVTPAPTTGAAPFSGEQPRRLAEDTSGTVAPQQAAAPQQTVAPQQTASRPATVDVAQIPPSPVVFPETRHPLPAVTAQATPKPAGVVSTAPVKPQDDVFQPFDDEAPAPAVVAARPAMSPPAATTVDNDPEFAPPLPTEEDLDIVAEPRQRSESVAAAPVTEVMRAPEVGDFPDPFPELSENAADDTPVADLASPFMGLTLDDELELPELPAPNGPDLAANPSSAADADFDPFAELDVPAKSGTAAAMPLPLPGDAPFPELQPVEDSGAPATLAEETEGDKAPQLTPLAAPQSQESPSRPGVPRAQPIVHQPEEETARKMTQIRDRGGMTGLKGFCPVSLRDDRELFDARPEFSAAYRGQKFHFASADARQRFVADPQRYVPAAYGADVVALVRDQDVVEGTLDHAAWFRGKLYLFASEQSHHTFVSEPSKYANPAGIE